MKCKRKANFKLTVRTVFPSDVLAFPLQMRKQESGWEVAKERDVQMEKDTEQTRMENASVEAEEEGWAKENQGQGTERKK